MQKYTGGVFKTPSQLILFLLILLVGALSSCNRFSDVSTESFPIYPDLVINMSRAPCMDSCPVYEITIKGDGSVTYYGWKYVEVVETREIKITQDEIRELVKEFEAINFLEIESPNLQIYDCPITAISFSLEGKRNKYYDYFVCNSDPFLYDKKVLEIAREIDKITNSEQWLGNVAVEYLESLAQ